MPAARALLAVIVLAVLVLPASATAVSRSAAGARQVAPTAASSKQVPALLAVAAGVADRYWGAVPCRGSVKVVAQRSLTSGAESGTDAWVTFDTPLGRNDLEAPAAGYTNCTIAFGRSRWPTAESMREDWQMLCLTMVHEVGHLLGHPHDATPGSVMAAVFTDLSSVPAACRVGRRR